MYLFLYLLKKDNSKHSDCICFVFDSQYILYRLAVATAGKGGATGTERIAIIIGGVFECYKCFN